MDAMAKRNKGGDDPGSGANWMDTYGDMVTLLLAFFVLLFSFSTIDAEKWEAIVGSLSGTGRSVIPVMDLQSTVSAPIQLEINRARDSNQSSAEESVEGNADRDMENFLALVASLENFIEVNALNAEIYPDFDTFTVILRVNDNIFFDSGDATIKQEAYPILDNLAQLFADNINLISTIDIEGHTDTDPIRTSQYLDNWDLSTKRATNTVRYLLQNEGIDPAKMTPTGLSEYHPVASNETTAGKAANRRVDFVIRSLTTSQ